ncbi:hypothetical protein D3C87_1504020 [compost metagenome]
MVFFVTQPDVTTGNGFQPKQRLAQARSACAGQPVYTQNFPAICLKVDAFQAISLQVCDREPGFAHRAADQTTAVRRRLISICIAHNSVNDGAFAQRLFAFVINHSAAAHDGCFITNTQHFV